MGEGREQGSGQGDSQGRGGRRRRRRRGKGGSANPQQPAQGSAHNRDARPSGGKPKQSESNRQPQQKQGGKPKQQNQPPQKSLKTVEDLRTGERQRDSNKPEPPFVHATKRYAVAIFDNLQSARAEIQSLTEKAQTVDQLNIVIRAESNMDDPELTAIPNAKIFAGTAWTLIHERRMQDGWYDAPR